MLMSVLWPNLLLLVVYLYTLRRMLRFPADFFAAERARQTRVDAWLNTRLAAIDAAELEKLRRTLAEEASAFSAKLDAQTAALEVLLIQLQDLKKQL